MKEYYSDKKISQLSEYLSPSKPIQSPEFLKGRFPELEKIDEILSFGGRSVFVVGDRGVGKTSLAQTAAILHTHSSYDYIYTASDPYPNASFGKLAKDLLIKLAGLAGGHHKESIETSSELSIMASRNPSVGFTRRWASVNSAKEIEEPDGASDVIRYLHGFGELLQKDLCIVIDELENIESQDCKASLAHLIKQIGDQDIPFKFIFSGIGDTPTNLIGIHESSSRYYGAIPLSPLKGQDIIDILKAPMNAFDINVPDGQLYRICTISCGYPHYPHLIGSKLFSNLLKNNEKISKTDNFNYAIEESVKDSHPYLMDSYSKATMRRTNREKTAIWSIADHRDIDQKIDDIYQNYQKLYRRYIGRIEKLTKEQFRAIFYKLQKEEYGMVVTKSPRRYFYRFNDPLMRGFARLSALSEGVELAMDDIID